MILKRNSKQDRRRRQRQLLNTGVQVFTDSVHVDALGINLSDVSSTGIEQPSSSLAMWLILALIG